MIALDSEFAFIALGDANRIFGETLISINTISRRGGYRLLMWLLYFWAPFFIILFVRHNLFYIN